MLKAKKESCAKQVDTIGMGGGKSLARTRVFAAFAAATALMVGLPPWSGAAPAQTAPSANDRALVASIQELLAALGYDAGPADGVAGQRTRQAILAFQRRAEMSADGRPSETLYHRLTTALNQGAPPARSPERSDPQSAAAPPPSATGANAGAASALLGPRWRITDETNGASIELVFEPAGRVGGLATARFWRWEQDGSIVRLFYDNDWGGRVVRVGRLAGDAMIGTAEGTDGKRWSWRAERISRGGGPEAASWMVPGQ